MWIFTVTRVRTSSLTSSPFPHLNTGTSKSVTLWCFYFLAPYPMRYFGKKVLEIWGPWCFTSSTLEKPQHLSFWQQWLCAAGEATFQVPGHPIVNACSVLSSLSTQSMWRHVPLVWVFKSLEVLVTQGTPHEATVAYLGTEGTITYICQGALEEQTDRMNLALLGSAVI